MRVRAVLRYRDKFQIEDMTARGLLRAGQLGAAAENEVCLCVPVLLVTKDSARGGGGSWLVRECILSLRRK